jgi:serine/threonine-protein kinase
VAFSLGQTIGDYQVMEVLGAGGMGTVYKVRHLISDRLEAIKLVLPELTENPDLMERFMREIKVQARLTHPHIASLHNALRVDNQLLMVMELVEGRTLHSVLQHGVMDPARAVDIVMQILSALEYAHAQGVVHRDIKPANIMLTNAGSVKLMDFGIARSASEDNPLTQTGAAVGSIYYMSPEQVQGLPVDARADLYSVGILLYEMATGVRPITGEGSYAIMNGHLHTIPRAPSSVNPQLPEPLSLAILKAIEKAKESRFQTARAFADSIAAVRSRMAGAGTPPARPMPQYQETELAVPPVRTPSPSGSTPPAPTGMRFDPEGLEKLTRDLAAFVGPMAKVLVSRAAKKAQTWRQLYDALAPEVPEGAERSQFLSKRP